MTNGDSPFPLEYRFIEEKDHVLQASLYKMIHLWPAAVKTSACFHFATGRFSPHTSKGGQGIKKKNFINLQNETEGGR